MFKIKSILAILLISGMTSLITACSSEQPVQQQVKAQEGWDNGQRVVYVQDNNGQQFLMNYLLFTSLMNQGGYNNVIHHHYTNPSTSRTVSSTFKPSRSINGFSQSYAATTKVNKTYKPSPALVSKLNTQYQYKSRTYSGNSTGYKINLNKSALPNKSYSKPSYTPKTYSRPSYTPSRPSYTPSRSYSSPSRSYSSPSRSYSRSYSSRSYSRH